MFIFRDLTDANNTKDITENNNIIQLENDNINAHCVDNVEIVKELPNYRDKGIQTFIPLHQPLNNSTATCKKFVFIDILTDHVKLNTGLDSFELDGIVECVSDLELNNVSKKKK